MAILSYKEALAFQHKARTNLKKAANWSEKKLAMKQFQSATQQVYSAYNRQHGERPVDKADAARVQVSNTFGLSHSTRASSDY